MIDPAIKSNIEILKNHINQINLIISELSTKGVDIQLRYDNNMNGKQGSIPTLELWRASEKVDYL